MRLLWLFMIIITPIWAGEPIVWQCTATDQQHVWRIETPYEKVSQMKVLDHCKKESSTPHSCRVSHATCVMTLHGVTQRPLWQCTALDRMAHAWRSTAFSSKYEAVAEAKADCHNHSTVPLSCYVNLSTCVNLGHRQQ